VVGIVLPLIANHSGHVGGCLRGANEPSGWACMVIVLDSNLMLPTLLQAFLGEGLS